MVTFLKRAAIASGLLILASGAYAAEEKSVPVMYPQDRTIVGNKVNIVLDPMEPVDFQVSVGGTEHPPIDASGGTHAFQGVPLEPGNNVITVSSILREVEKGKVKVSILSSRTIEVFNRDGAFSPAPSGFKNDPFHSKDREELCGNCHRLDVTPEDRAAAKPVDVLCYACHRRIPQGRHIHGPAAVWNCLACHDPDTAPSKYSFTGSDSPSNDKKSGKRAMIVKEACLSCHRGIDSGKFRHGPADAGYCNLCHDPHASPYPAWLRKSSWDLCSTCHPEQGTGVHVVAGFATGKTHPTKRKRDRSRPGERLSCASCHDPHSAEHPYLYQYGARTRNEMCARCHGQK